MKTYEVYLKHTGINNIKIIATVQAGSRSEAIRKGREESAQRGAWYPYEDCGARAKRGAA
jgi:hypothetical protein